MSVSDIQGNYPHLSYPLHVYINLSLHADILDPRRWENTYDLIKLYQTCLTHCDLALPYWPVAIGAFFDK